MDQKTTSLWIATAPAPRFDSFRDEVHVDVAIIGGGITGLTAALLLKQRGKRVAVLEKAQIAGGETGYTTAHITEAIDARYFSIARTFSREAAREVGEASRASIEQIAQFVDQYKIACAFRRVPGYLYTEKRSYVAELKKEAVAAAEAGVAASFVDEVPLPFATRGAVRFENQAQFHPRQYMIALASQIPGNGSFIFDETHVSDITEGEPCVVETTSGKLTADVVFQATNVPIVGFTSLFLKDAAYRTYALGYLVEGPHPDGLFWDTADPYHYTRWQETDSGTYMIVGGEDHKVGQTEEDSFERLKQYATGLYGEKPLRYQWSGQVINPVDGLPYIGGSDKMLVSTGYAGQGMTFGTLGAMIIADRITGRKNRWAELFDANRKHVRGAVKEFLTENADFPKHMIKDRLLRGDVEGKLTSEVATGEGKILSLDGRKVAVYRDEKGDVQVVSPVCTHMGCDVAWNGNEKTWDCPCHGSRFKTDGAVINGPATKPLAPIDLE